MRIYLCFSCIFVFNTVNAAIKQWLPDTDWQNVNNWDQHELPCIHSSVLFPQDVVLSIYMHGNVSWDTLILPDTGELILENDFNFIAYNENPCSHGERRFLNWKAKSWFHPDNWAFLGEDHSVVNKWAVPHTEQIPCPSDSVIFPDHQGFVVDLQNVPSITVAHFKHGEHELKNSDIYTHLHGGYGKYQFHNYQNNFQLFVNSTSCGQDCMCDRTQEITQLVCSNIGSSCSEGLICDRAFKPIGHCCVMCGGMISLKVNEQIFSKSAVDQLVESFREREDKTGTVSTYVLRIDQNTIQITVADNTTNEMSTKIAESIHSYLRSTLNQGNIYGIASINLTTSGRSQAAQHSLSAESWKLIVSNLMTFFGIVAILVLASVFFFLYRRRRIDSNQEEFAVGFTRFHNETVNVEIGVEPDRIPEYPEPVVGVTEPATENRPPEVRQLPVEKEMKTNRWKKFTRAFANPLFGNPAAARLSGRWSMSSLLNSTATQENPIYNVTGVEKSETSATGKAGHSAQDPLESSVGTELNFQDIPLASSSLNEQSADRNGQDAEADSKKKLWNKAVPKLKVPEKLNPTTPDSANSSDDHSANRGPSAKLADIDEDKLELTLCEETSEST